MLIRGVAKYICSTPFVYALLLIKREGLVYFHLHITCSDETFKALGGHLNQCRISGTAEVVLTAMSAGLDRCFDPATGLNSLSFNTERKEE